ncbi:MAG: hypothetical protein HY711_02465, partial [Candidatus Melainabacteria bacterium]|nr:hypothetical protein [Candidatus Melainabacteria bacterium]
MTKILAPCLVFMVLLAGCASENTTRLAPLPPHSAGSTTFGHDSTLTAHTGPNSSVASFPNPGAFKLVEKLTQNGQTVEYWQARGQSGIYGGTLRVSTFGGGPKTFNYWAATDVESSGLGLLMFERLIDTDAWTGAPYPRLARAITISHDKREYTITLRKGLTWSDGRPITADDVVFTFGTIVAKGYGNSSLRDTLSVYGKFPSIEKVDALTVRFRTSVPFVPFLSGLANVPLA